MLQSRLYSYADTHRHRLGVNYQQLPVNAPRPSYKMANFQRDGLMAYSNQGSRPNYFASVGPVSTRPVNPSSPEQRHNEFIATATRFLAEIRPEDFNQPRVLWSKVFDDEAKERFIGNVAGHMKTCRDKDIIKRQIAIFREVSDDLATRLEDATGIKGYDGISNIVFNGCHNGMAKAKAENRAANGNSVTAEYAMHNGAPFSAK